MALLTDNGSDAGFLRLHVVLISRNYLRLSFLRSMLQDLVFWPSHQSSTQPDVFCPDRPEAQK